MEQIYEKIHVQANSVLYLFSFCRRDGGHAPGLLPDQQKRYLPNGRPLEQKEQQRPYHV